MLRAIRVAAGFLSDGLHYVQRRRNRGRLRPDLQIEYIYPPYWGGTRLDLSIRNAGTVPARNCRYARVQWFTMAGTRDAAPAVAVRQWYASDRMTIPANGDVISVASLTLGPCPQGILDDIVRSYNGDAWYLDAIVCQDAAGEMYRFRPHLTSESEPERWGESLIDHFRGRPPPVWTRWVRTPDAIECAAWTESG